MIALKKKYRNLKRRRRKVRRHVVCSPERPRLLVQRSLAHIYAQIIEDGTGATLLSVSTRDAAVRTSLKGAGNVEAAKAVGKAVGERAIAKGITQVCFDRGGRHYHGRVKALAEGAREAGLKF